MPQDVVFSNQDRYPFDNVDLRKMNRIIRHRLRNLCAGVKMTVEKIASVTSQTHPQMADRCSLIVAELENLREFTDRMDRLFDNLPAPEPKSLFDILCDAREFFIKKFPFCHLELDGGELAASFKHGSWFVIAMREIIANAGEAAGASGTVRLAWAEKDGSVTVSVSNPGEPPPPEIPLNPPRPFNTLRSRHDGIGLAIANRICEEAGASLSIESSPETTAVHIKISPEELANG